MKIRTFIATALTALTLATPAMAATPVTTDVEAITSSQIEQNFDDDNLSWSAPVVIQFAVKSDGNIIAPSDEALYIQNKSVFPIHLTKFNVKAAEPFSLVSDTKDTKTKNVFEFLMNGYQVQENQDVSKDELFNMSYAGDDENDKVKLLIVEAKMRNIDVDISKPTKIAKITWTVAPGNTAQTKTPEPGPGVVTTPVD